jgi:FHS family L-fucose permease-like MFS transporter
MSGGLAHLLPSGWTFAQGSLFHISERGAGNLLAVALLLFFFGRVTGSLALRALAPHKTLALYGLINAILMALVVLPLGWISVAALMGTFFFMSIMFPTIFSLGIQGLGKEETKTASSFIVMSIGGGAVFPLLNGWISGHFSVAVGFIVPLICFAVVCAYGAMWERLYHRTRA